MGLLDVKLKGCEILDNLGLGHEIREFRRVSTVFRTDFLNIADKYYNYKYLNTTPYSDMALAIALIWEVIEHYHIAGDLGACLFNNNIKLSTFEMMNNGIRDWCKKEYWKDGFEYWDEKMEKVLAGIK